MGQEDAVASNPELQNQQAAGTNPEQQNQEATGTNPKAQNPQPAPVVDDEEVIDLGNLKSDVWQHFTKIRKGEFIKAKCSHCKKLLAGESNNGTSHLRNHLKTCIQRKIQDGKQKVLGANFVTKGKKEMVATQFNEAVSRQDLVMAVLMHDYSLSMVDHLYFRRFLSGLQPLFSVPTRNTLRSDIFKIYNSEKSRIMKLVGSNKGRVAITTDMWTASNQKKGYMAVTAHYVDNSWILRSHLLRFAYVPTPHTSDRLATALFDSMMDWNVDSKVSTITLDNCSTNDSLIEKVKNKLVMPCLIKRGVLLHMRCSAHILNLIVKDGLDVLRDGIETIRESVSYWTATPRRVELFEGAAKQLGFSCDKKLSLDCPTRWNSTYLMLVAAIPYQNVFIRLKQRNSHYTCLPSSDHWAFASIVCGKLEIFSEISNLFSGTKYPTANLFFPKICDLKLKLCEWLVDDNAMISKMAELMWDKFLKYWGDIHEILAVAVVLDPRYKLHIVDYYARKFDKGQCVLDVDKVRAVLSDLIMEYQAKQNKNAMVASRGSSDHSIGSSSSVDLDFQLFVQQRKKSRGTPTQTDLDNYLNEEVLPWTTDFDILLWWKMNGAKYPILQDIARDMLAVPVTSVASESAFSNGGRVLNPNRCKLGYTTMEALMCTKSWLQNSISIADPGTLEEICALLDDEDDEADIEDQALGNENAPYQLIED